MDTKGLKDGSCNLTACQLPNSAVYYNKSTEAYYCSGCAEGINWEGGRADVMKLYGVPLLCELYEGFTVPKDMKEIDVWELLTIEDFREWENANE